MIVKIYAGLGNQMFQYAFYLALKNNYPQYDVYADVSLCHKQYIHNGFELDRVFGIKDCKCIDRSWSLTQVAPRSLNFLRGRGVRKICFANQYVELLLGYYEDVFCQKNKKLFFDGVWQSADYFSQIHQQVRNVFRFPEMDDERNAQLINEMRSCNSVSLHIRRGDYLKVSKYIDLSITDYYRNAIEYILKNVSDPHFYLFSDDIPWCVEYLKDLPVFPVFINWNKGKDSYKDMQLMAECRHNIIANSSFSWWGAWLNANEDKIVVAPNKFFNGDIRDESHLIPNEWIKL